MRSVLLFVALAGFAAHAATPLPELKPGDHLPQLKGEFLTGHAGVLPDAAKGKAAVLLLGFTYDSRFTVEAWSKKFRKEFGNDSRITFFEVPMIGGMGVLGKPFITGGMRRGTPKPDQEHVMTVFGGIEPWKQRVGFREPNAAYIILIDADGNVIWLGSGDASDEHYQKLAAEIRKLPGGK